MLDFLGSEVGLRKVFSTQDDVALLNRIREELEHRGIRCIVRNELRSGLAAGELPPLMHWPELLIADESRFDEARAIIEDFTGFTPRDAADWQCEACNEMVESIFAACWNCSTPRKLRRSLKRKHVI